MRLSRSKKVVLIGTALLTIGLAGRAAAETTTAEPAKPKVTGSTSAPAAGKSSTAASAPSPGKPAANAGTAGASAGTPGTAAGTPGTTAGKPGATAGTPGATTGKPGATTGKPGTTAGKPGAATTKPATPAKAVRVAAKHPVGPAGSLMVTGSKAVALTFDDGPDPAQTPRILKLLAAQHVHATFCLVGKNVRKHPELVRQIVAGGHTLCDHSWNHSLTLGKKSPAKIRADLQRTNDAIRKAAPGAKVKYFRAPGGNFTPRLTKIAKQLGMTSIYWRVDPRDWDHPQGETHAAHRAKVIHAVEKHTHAGSIILSHDYAQPDTITAYRTLIPWLRHRYQLIALP